MHRVAGRERWLNPEVVVGLMSELVGKKTSGDEQSWSPVPTVLEACFVG